jgi:hypothetical protein
VVNSRDLDALPREIARIGREQEELSERSANARRYAALHFTPDGFASRFEEVLLAVAER